MQMLCYRRSIIFLSGQNVPMTITFSEDQSISVPHTKMAFLSLDINYSWGENNMILKTNNSASNDSQNSLPLALTAKTHTQEEKKWAQGTSATTEKLTPYIG